MSMEGLLIFQQNPLATQALDLAEYTTFVFIGSKMSPLRKAWGFIVCQEQNLASNEWYYSRTIYPQLR